MSPIETQYDPQHPPHFPQAQQNDVAGPYQMPLGLEAYSESSLLDGSGHIFNFCLETPWAEKTRLESNVSDLRGFAAAETGLSFSLNLTILRKSSWWLLPGF